MSRSVNLILALLLLGPAAHPASCVLRPTGSGNGAGQQVAGHRILKIFNSQNSYLGAFTGGGHRLDPDVVFEDSHERFWFGGNSGPLVAMYEDRTGRWNVFTADPEPRETFIDQTGAILPTDTVTTIVESSDGRIWFSASFGETLEARTRAKQGGNGVYVTYFDGTRWGIPNVPLGTDATRGQAVCGLGAFPGRDGRVWFWRDSRLTSYDGRGWSHTIELKDIFGPGSGRWFISAGAEDRQGRLWLQTEQGVIRSDAARRNWARFPQISGTQIIYQDHEGRLWFGGYRSLVAIDTNGEQIRAYWPPASLRGLGPDSYLLVTGICQDREGRMILALGQRLLTYDERNDKWESFDIEPLGLGSLAWRILEDHSGRIWITTGGGVLVLDP